MENILTSAEHFDLYDILIQLVQEKRMTRSEMDGILKKSGLTRTKGEEYRDEEGSVLTMK